MADNYLEKRYDEVFGTKKTVKKVGQTLDSLLTKNRSCRGYSHDVLIGKDVLHKIVGVNTKIPSARNQQALRFRIVDEAREVEIVNQNIKMGGALPELHLPFKGTEPQSFIVVCSKIEPDSNLYIDLGISLQSMLLKAVEIGLNGLIIRAFNAQNIKEKLGLNIVPIAILCIGKSIERYQLQPIAENDSHKYYRTDDGVHCIPKINLNELIIK